MHQRKQDGLPLVYCQGTPRNQMLLSVLSKQLGRVVRGEYHHLHRHAKPPLPNVVEHGGIRWTVSGKRKIDPISGPLLFLSHESILDEFMDLVVKCALEKDWLVVDAALQHGLSLESLLVSLCAKPRGQFSPVYVVTSLEGKAVVENCISCYSHLVGVFIVDGLPFRQSTDLDFPHIMLHPSSTKRSAWSSLRDPNCFVVAPAESAFGRIKTEWQVQIVFSFLEAVTTLKTKTLPLGWLSAKL